MIEFKKKIVCLDFFEDERSYYAKHYKVGTKFYDIHAKHWEVGEDVNFDKFWFMEVK